MQTRDFSPRWALCHKFICQVYKGRCNQTYANKMIFQKWDLLVHFEADRTGRLFHQKSYHHPNYGTNLFQARFWKTVFLFNDNTVCMIHSIEWAFTQSWRGSWIFCILERLIFDVTYQRENVSGMKVYQTGNKVLHTRKFKKNFTNGVSMIHGWENGITLMIMLCEDLILS